MRPQVLSVVNLAQNATSQWIPVDFYQTPANIGLALNVTTGTFDLQYTFDNVLDPTIGTPVAYTHATITGITTTKADNLAVPVAAVRLKNTAIAAGNATLNINQGAIY